LATLSCLFRHHPGIVLAKRGVVMQKLVRVLVLWLGLWGLGLVPAAAAAAVGPAQTKQVQLVVRAQLAAFAGDDAPRAFSYAAASIQQMFGNPDQFMQMVRSSYPVVYRPASVRFLAPKADGKTIVQPVHMTDDQGGSWLAVYRVQQQKDKSWRIAGCVLVADSGQSI
jgi:Domain of unknown function (DUF4864)